MKRTIKILFAFIFSLSFFHCTAQKKNTFKAREIYRSDKLFITQIAPNSFEHTSFLQTNDFGKVECNGLVVRSNGETVVFDTPANDSASVELINWIKDSLHCKINAVVPTHFHNDCLGGLQAFHDHQIPSYAYFKTIAFAKENKYVVPQNAFNDSLTLKVGNENVTAKFFGEGHTRDNVVGYFATENVLFGGCLIKEVDASKGYLGDANVGAWSATVTKLKRAYPQVRIVVPGHGEYGNGKLLDYTIRLFSVK